MDRGADMRLRSQTVFIITTLAAVCGLAMPAGALPVFSTSPRHAADPHPNQETQLWRLRPANDSTFDRIVFDERFSPSGYTVRYVRHVIADGSGKRVHLKGKFFLSVSVPNTSTSGAAGTPTNVHHVYSPDLPEVVQIKKTGEFEDVVSFGIGLRHRNGFRVFRLHSPERLVIDILH
jgi:hypothetical protein